MKKTSAFAQKAANISRASEKPVLPLPAGRVLPRSKKGTLWSPEESQKTLIRDGGSLRQTSKGRTDPLAKELSCSCLGGDPEQAIPARYATAPVCSLQEPGANVHVVSELGGLGIQGRGQSDTGAIQRTNEECSAGQSITVEPNFYLSSKRPLKPLGLFADCLIERSSSLCCVRCPSSSSHSES